MQSHVTPTPSTPAPGSAPRFGESSLTKAIVYFKDGNERTFYSRDGSDRFTPADPRELGLRRLRGYIERTAQHIERALIYDRVTDQVVARFERGMWG